jgi:hypothetical protein
LKPSFKQMSVVLGVPGQPSGHAANAQRSSGTRVPNGIAGPLGRGESLSASHNSASAAALFAETLAKLLNALPPLNGSVHGLVPLKLRSPNSVRIRSVIGWPCCWATGKRTVRRLSPGAMSAPHPTHAIT